MDIDTAIIEICSAMKAERERVGKLEDRLEKAEQRVEQLVNELIFRGFGYKKAD
tara:strand:+ start:2625 stop:2786 length:162 start_codon:yes stop_codon:yes gene_type:complete